jgi:hypothetical protein
MFVLCFFVSAELLPYNKAFLETPDHYVLYAMAGFFEIFFGSIFVVGFPSPDSSTAVEYMGLLLVNLAVAGLMTSIVHCYLCIFTIVWWLTCLIVVSLWIGGDFKSQLQSKIREFKEE